MAFSTIPVNRCDIHMIQEARKEIIRIARIPAKAPLKAGVQIVKLFTFSGPDALADWEEKIFKGRTLYRTEKDKANSYIRARSNDAASALYYKVRLDAKNKRPFISWRWKVVKFPAKEMPEDMESHSQDDFAARVYVIFLTNFVPNSKVLEYIWAEYLPAGMVGTSPLSKNIKLIVARSGMDLTGQWCREERDILADYRMAFGKVPEHDIGAIAIMTNTDNNHTDAEAMYDDLCVGYKQDVKDESK